MAQMIELRVTVDDTQLAEMEKSVDRLGGTIQKTGQRGNVVFTGFAKQQRQAREAAQLLSQTVGVQLPGSVERLIAKSRILAPVLSSAFKVVAAVAFIAAVGHVINNLDELHKKARDVRRTIASIFQPDLRETIRGEKTRELLEPVKAQLLAIHKQAALAGKEGFGLITEQLKQSNLELDEFRSKFLKSVQDRLGLGTDAGIAVALKGENQIKTARLILQELSSKQEMDLRRKIRDETIQIENQVLAVGLNATAAIFEARRQTIERINDLERRGLLTHEDAERRRVAATQQSHRTINDMLRKEAEEERDLAQQAQAAMAENAVPEFMRGVVRIQREAAAKIADVKRQLNEDFHAMIVNRTELTAEELNKLVAAETIAQNKIVDINQIAAAKIIEEQRQMRDRLAEYLESWADDIAGGRGLQRVLREFKKMVFQMVATWAMGLRQMGGATAGGNALSLGNVLGGAFGGGTVPGGAAGGLGTPPLVQNFSSAAAQGATGAGAQLSSGQGTAAVAAQQAAQGGGPGFMGQMLGKINPVLLGGGLALGGIMHGITTGSKGMSSLMGGVGGAILGMSLIGGPIGLIAGGIVGGLAALFGGIFGSGRIKKKTNAAIENEYKPVLKQIVDAYMVHQLEYQGAMGEIQQFSAQAQAELKQRFGNIGKQKFGTRLMPLITQARADINRVEAERARRGAMEFGPPQFHSGGVDIRAGRREFAALLEEGESVISRRGTQANRGTLNAIKNGATVAAGNSGPTIYIDKLYAMDAQSFEKWAVSGGRPRVFRKAVEADGLEYAG